MRAGTANMFETKATAKSEMSCLHLTRKVEVEDCWYINSNNGKHHRGKYGEENYLTCECFISHSFECLATGIDDLDNEDGKPYCTTRFGMDPVIWRALKRRMPEPLIEFLGQVMCQSSGAHSEQIADFNPHVCQHCLYRETATHTTHL